MEDRLVRRFFEAADSFDTERFLATLSSDVVWRFANSPEVVGTEAVRGSYNFIKEALNLMQHELIGVWRSGECWIAETRVTYQDKSGRRLVVPACNLLFERDGLFREIRIFVDNHELFLPHGS